MPTFDGVACLVLAAGAAVALVAWALLAHAKRRGHDRNDDRPRRPDPGE